VCFLGGRKELWSIIYTKNLFSVLCTSLPPIHQFKNLTILTFSQIVPLWILYGSKNRLIFSWTLIFFFFLNLYSPLWTLASLMILPQIFLSRAFFYHMSAFNNCTYFKTLLSHVNLGLPFFPWANINLVILLRDTIDYVEEGKPICLNIL
jgi:hypothetical protein